MKGHTYLHFVGWDRFQHYGKRRPIWIKNYNRLLTSDAYRGLSGFRRGLLHGLWMEYAETCTCSRDERDLRCTCLGLAPDLLNQRLGLAAKMSDYEALNHAGFVTFFASRVLAAAPFFASPEVEKEKNPPVVPPRPKAKKREPDLLWDAMVVAFSIDSRALTDSARGVLNRAVGELRKVGAEPSEVPVRKAAYERKMPDAVCTPPALVKHWPYLDAQSGLSAAAVADQERNRDLVARMRRNGSHA